MMAAADREIQVEQDDVDIREYERERCRCGHGPFQHVEGGPCSRCRRCTGYHQPGMF